MIYFGCGPLPVIVANEGLVSWDSLLKMVHNPGGHWHPGRGPHPRKRDFVTSKGFTSSEPKLSQTGKAVVR